MQHIIPNLKNLCAINFTGKVNVQLKPRNQHIATIYVLDGNIVNCKYQKLSGYVALTSLILFEQEGDPELSVVSEPEIVSEKEVFFSEGFEDLVKRLQVSIEEHIKLRKYKPPEDVKVGIRNSFVELGPDLGFKEFEVLCSLTKYNNVKDIYRNLDLEETEVTLSLVKLRKKNALYVSK
ncbi:MAG: hypothetical protein ACPGJV_14410 [Bacteriovoracaceae bacterium]